MGRSCEHDDHFDVTVQTSDGVKASIRIAEPMKRTTSRDRDPRA